MSNVTSVSLHDRYVGTLLGLACGDALGGPVEFVKRDEIEARFPNGVSEFIGGGWLRLAPGEVTDDTQQALILAESLTTSGLDLDRAVFGVGELRTRLDIQLLAKHAGAGSTKVLKQALRLPRV